MSSSHPLPLGMIKAGILVITLSAIGILMPWHRPVAPASSAHSKPPVAADADTGMPMDEDDDTGYASDDDTVNAALLALFVPLPGAGRGMDFNPVPIPDGALPDPPDTKTEIYEVRTAEFDVLWKQDPNWTGYSTGIRSCHRASFVTDPKLSYDQARARCLANPHYQNQ